LNAWHPEPRLVAGFPERATGPGRFLRAAGKVNLGFLFAAACWLAQLRAADVKRIMMARAARI